MSDGILVFVELQQDAQLVRRDCELVASLHTQRTHFCLSKVVLHSSDCQYHHHQPMSARAFSRSYQPLYSATAILRSIKLFKDLHVGP